MDQENIQNALMPGAGVAALAACVHALTTALCRLLPHNFTLSPDNIAVLASTTSTVALLVTIARYVSRRMYFIDANEQLRVQELSGHTRVINGPKIMLLPALIKGVEKCKATTLGERQYCTITDEQSGHERIEHGPKLLRLGPYDRVVGSTQEALSLKATEFVRFLDRGTGRVRVVQGEQGCVMPQAGEVFMDRCGKRAAIDLKVFEYVRIEDKKSGVSRVERGEGLVFLEAHEEVVDGGKQRAVEVDDETAVLVRNKRDGQQSLVTARGLFIPSADEEVLEIRPLIKLADYEAC